MEDYRKRKPRRNLFSYVPRLAASNSRPEREAKANVARILSSARLILKAFEFDSSPHGQNMRDAAALTIELWEKA